MSTSCHEIEDQYFYTPSLKGLVQQLTHLAFFGEGMSVVTGASDSGKSSLALELEKHLNQAHEVVSLVLDADLELGECVERLSDALGLARSESLSVGEMLTELRHFVQSLSQDKKLVVLLIDEAHHLDDQAVGALVSLLQGGTDSQAGLHLILLSESGLGRRIDALQILDVPVYKFDIPNFSPSELSNFLSRDSRLQSSLNSSLVQKLWANSQGLPGLALKLVEGGAGEGVGGSSKKLFSSGIPFGHIAAILLLALILIWSLVIRDTVDTEEPSVAAVTSVGVKAADDEEKPLDDGIVEGAAESRFNNSYDEVDSGVYEHLLEGAVYSSGEKGMAEVESSIGEGYESSAEIVEDRNVVSAAPSKPSIVKPEVEEPPAIAVNVDMMEPPRAEVFELEAPELEAVGLGVAGATVWTEQEVFLMAQNSNFYTLQVVATSKKSSLEDYMSRQPNKDTLYMYRGMREGKSWYVVVQGVYSSRNSALKARHSLPKEQAKAGPWPRILSSIQEEIETFRRN